MLVTLVLEPSGAELAYFSSDVDGIGSLHYLRAIRSDADCLNVCRRNFADRRTELGQ